MFLPAGFAVRHAPYVDHRTMRPADEGVVSAKQELSKSLAKDRNAAGFGSSHAEGEFGARRSFLASSTCGDAGLQDAACDELCLGVRPTIGAGRE